MVAFIIGRRKTNEGEYEMRIFLCIMLLSIATGCCPETEPSEFHKYDVNQDVVVTPLDVVVITNYLNEHKDD